MGTSWQSIKQHISDDISETQYKYWIEPIKCLSVDENSMTLECPNPFFINWIRDNYLTNLKKIIKQHFGKEILLHLKTANNNTPNRLNPLDIGKEPVQQFLPTMAANIYNRLLPSFTFDDFVVGAPNNLAYAAALSMANGYNDFGSTLYIQSNTGLGKSHLTHAVGNLIIKKKTTAKIIYNTAEDFTNELIGCLRNKRMEFFKEKYRRNCDILLLEGMQFFSGKKTMQNELSYTLDTLLSHDKKIILTGTRQPSDILDISDKFKSRLASGLITSISPPDFETRVKILQKKASNKKIKLPLQVSEFIANYLGEDVRQLESSILGLFARAKLMNNKINIQMAREVINNVLEIRQRITIDSINEMVCRSYMISPKELLSKSRKKLLVEARNIIMYLCRKYTNNSLETIGKTYGRSHATVIHAIKKIDKEKNLNSSTAKKLVFLTNKIEQ